MFDGDITQSLWKQASALIARRIEANTAKAERLAREALTHVRKPDSPEASSRRILRSRARSSRRPIAATRLSRLGTEALEQLRAQGRHPARPPHTTPLRPPRESRLAAALQRHSKTPAESWQAPSFPVETPTRSGAHAGRADRMRMEPKVAWARLRNRRRTGGDLSLSRNDSDRRVRACCWLGPQA